MSFAGRTFDASSAEPKQDEAILTQKVFQTFQGLIKFLQPLNYNHQYRSRSQIVRCTSRCAERNSRRFRLVAAGNIRVPRARM